MGAHNSEPQIFTCNSGGFLSKTQKSVGARAPTAPTLNTPLFSQLTSHFTQVLYRYRISRFPLFSHFLPTFPFLPFLHFPLLSPIFLFLPIFPYFSIFSFLSFLLIFSLFSRFPISSYFPIFSILSHFQPFQHFII